VQAHLVALADGEMPPSATPEPPDLATFVASLSSAWRAGEVRLTFSVAAKPRYLRSLQSVSRADAPPARTPASTVDSQPAAPPAQPPLPAANVPQRPQLIYAGADKGSFRALKAVWPIVCRRLEGCPNINSSQLFEELCVQFPGRFNVCQRKTLGKRVKVWRQDARARGVVIDHIKWRNLTHKPRGIRPDPFKAHWAEMLECLEARPDQIALELLLEFRARYPERYTLRQLATMWRRLRVWRREAVKWLICDSRNIRAKMKDPTKCKYLNCPFGHIGNSAFRRPVPG